VTTAGRDPFARYRERLDAVGFRPSSTRGQNFLLDPSLHRCIADAAAPRATDLVLEVGVGLGFLTRELAPRCAALVGVEIDDRLLAIARDELRPFANVELVLADAIGGDGGTLHPAVTAALAARQPADGAFLVVANLPYAASGPLLAELSCLHRAPDRIVVLVQRELAQRLAAAPGSSDYGGLAAQLQVGYAIEQLRTVGAEVFRPRPKVQSALLRLERRADAPVLPAAARRQFSAFARTLFGKRRKVLRTTLAEAAAAIGGQLPALGEALLARRAETLTPRELLDLWARTAPPRAAGAP